MPETEQNRRSKIRVDFQTRIVVTIPASGITLEGDSSNLSVKGILIKTDEKIPMNTPCGVKIYLSGTAVPLCLAVEGKVVRIEPTGIAIAFHSMDIDSYAELRNIVRYNSQEPDDVY
jgi:hypothetical protein